MSYRFINAKPGNEYLRNLCEQAGLEFKAEYNLGRLDQKIKEAEEISRNQQQAAASAAKPTPGAPKSFGEAVAGLCLGGMSKGRAVEAAAHKFPALHADYRANGCVESLTAHLDTPGNFTQLVSAQEKLHGKSKAQAVRYCISNFPEAYAEWRQSGDTAHL